jgi:hypothetical protein
VIAYRKFSEALKSGVDAPTPPKPAKPPKGNPAIEVDTRTLGGLVDLGACRSEIQNLDAGRGTWTDAEGERAAIIEYEGGASRDWAEALARLDPGKPPRHVPRQRWLRFVDDCGRFLDGGWIDKAAAIGWGPLHLFGCDRKRPFARLDNMGLIWFLNGGKIIELHRDQATIETRMGARLCYRCRPIEVGRVVLPWELAP